MALIVDGIEPTAIEIDGNSDINALEVDGVYYWGKPFTLTINAGTGTTVVVNRSQSKYQNAPTETLTTGSLIYYGDTIYITASTLDGYVLSDFTVNDTVYTNTSASLTVFNNITIATVANKQEEWQTVWTGTRTVTGTSSTGATGTLSVSTITAFSDYTRVRISGTTYKDKTSFTEISAKSNSGVFSKITIYDNGKTQTIQVLGDKNIYITATGTNVLNKCGLIINKIEVI